MPVITTTHAGYRHRTPAPMALPCDMPSNAEAFRASPDTGSVSRNLDWAKPPARGQLT